jgi:hypothetical protein
MYGELRAQGARHEAIARDALARLEESEARERKHLRELGSARQRISELDATASNCASARPLSEDRPAAAQSHRTAAAAASSSNDKARGEAARLSANGWAEVLKFALLIGPE